MIVVSEILADKSKEFSYLLWQIRPFDDLTDVYPLVFWKFLVDELFDEGVLVRDREDFRDNITTALKKKLNIGARKTA